MSEQKLTRRQQAELYLKDPNVRRYLDLLAFTEGTEKHGYHTKFGGGKIDDLTWHPNVNWDRTGDGPTSATGRYQFLKGTWGEQAKKLGLKDFGPESQDLAAVSLIMQRGAIEDILNGDVDSANRKLSKEWASLPYNNSPHQKQKTTEEVLQKWEQLGGKDYAVPAQKFDYRAQDVLQSAPQPTSTSPLQHYSQFLPTDTAPIEPFETATHRRKEGIADTFHSLNNTFDSAVPQGETALTGFSQPDYSDKLASAFGVAPSTKGKIPDYIGEMIQSIYDQTA